MDTKLGMSGKLKTKVSRYLLWHVKTPFGRLWMTRDKGEGMIGNQIFMSNLAAEIHRDGKLVGTYDLGSGLVTNAGVNLMAADWTNANATIKVMNYHDSGTGTTAAAITDTALQTATGIARVAGTQSNTTNVYKSVATITYNATFNITEWGLFSAATTGTMWDHRVFTAIPVVNGDQITFTYSLTVQSGG